LTLLAKNHTALAAFAFLLMEPCGKFGQILSWLDELTLAALQHAQHSKLLNPERFRALHDHPENRRGRQILSERIRDRYEDDGTASVEMSAPP